MNNIEYKYTEGQYAYGVHVYPTGARIFEGIITKVMIIVRPSPAPNHKRLVSIIYELSGVSLFRFSETEIFETKEMAEEFKNYWLKSIEKND